MTAIDRPVNTMDVAYLAIGALTAWNAAADAQRDAMQGQDHYIGQVISCAPVIATIYRATGDAYAGCWYYEVSETVGEIVGAKLLKDPTIDPCDTARRIALTQAAAGIAP